MPWDNGFIRDRMAEIPPWAVDINGVPYPEEKTRLSGAVPRLKTAGHPLRERRPSDGWPNHSRSIPQSGWRPSSSSMRNMRVYSSSPGFSTVLRQSSPREWSPAHPRCPECVHCLRECGIGREPDITQQRHPKVQAHYAADKKAARLETAANKALKRAAEALEAVRAEQNAERAGVDEGLIVLQREVIESLNRRGMVLQDVEIDLASRCFHLRRDIHFSSGTAAFAVQEEAESLLDEVADALDICNRVLANKGHRPLGLCLEGHTDSDDLALSAKRAEVCRDYLVRRLCRLRGDEDMEASAALISSQGFGSGGLGRRCVMAKVVVEDDYVEEGEDAWRETPEHLQTLTQQMCGAAERNADVAKGAAEEARRVVEQAAKEAEEEIAEEEAIVRAKVEEAGRVRKQLEALEVGQRLAMELEGLMYRLQAQEHESRQAHAQAEASKAEAREELEALVEARFAAEEAAEAADRKARAATEAAEAKAEAAEKAHRETLAMRNCRREAEKGIQEAKAGKAEAEAVAKAATKAKRERIAAESAKRHAEAMAAEARRQRDKVLEEIRVAKEKHAQWMAEQHLLIKRIAQDREEATKIKREAERAARAKRAAEQHLIELQARVDHLRAENRAEEIERRIRADQELLALQAKAENQMASRGISLENVKIDLASRRLHLLRDIKFVMGSCEFSDEEEAHELLEQVATAFDACNRELSLEGQPPLDLMVEGHTDTDNQELSKDRAEACKVYLVKRLQTIAEGDGEWGSLSEVKAVGHSNRVINRQAVVMRVVVPGEEAELPGTAVLPM